MEIEFPRSGIFPQSGMHGGEGRGLVLDVLSLHFFSANTYLFKVNNRNTTKRCRIYSKWTRKTPRIEDFC